MMTLPSVLGGLTITEIEQRFRGAQGVYSGLEVDAKRQKIEIITKLIEVEAPIVGCEGANFFEHVVSGVAVLPQEAA